MSDNDGDGKKEGGDETGKGKLYTLPGGGTPNLTAESIRRFKADLPFIMQYSELAAALHRHKFLELRKTGFDDKQALELCKILP